jgi:hypothetical protein
MLALITIKQQREQAAFAEFVRRMGTEDKWLHVCCQPEPEPDLLCYHADDGLIAFELVSLTDQKIAQLQAAGSKSWNKAFWTLDGSERIIRDKLGKKYTTNASRIELLVYTDGQIITPDDAIIPTVLPLFDEVAHPFKRVWFMGEQTTCCLWNDS